MAPADAVRRRLSQGPGVLLDGPMGSELVRRGVRWRGHGMLTDAETVKSVHLEYLAAGADVIRTNTFQLNRRTYLNVFRNPDHMRHIGAPGLERRAEELTRRAVDLARQARQEAGRPEVAIAGVMAPLEHCFRPDLAPPPDQAAQEHRELAGWLAEAGCDLLLLESMNTAAEAQVATRAARETGLPFWASFVVDGSARLLGGEAVDQAARMALQAGAEAVLVNCAPPEDCARAVAVLAGLAAERAFPCGAYAHVGKFDPPSWKFEFFPQFSHTESWPPERYVPAARLWKEQGARIIGGCCGTTPAHIALLRDAL